MSEPLELRNLNKTFRARGRDTTVALDDVSLSLPPGELVVLLGPSGCGKSTTLRSLAGLESPDSGEIQLGEQMLFDSRRRVDLPPERRDIGMVFQNFALWPHMTVSQIVQFPLVARRKDKATARARAGEALELVNCSELANRHPGQLSGGQQQRVALARALAASPGVLLFDEPLSNLDAALRTELRSEINRLHRETGFTGVYVTHDQVEALAVADRIAIMNTGKLVQVDAAAEVYRRPCNEWVAGFMGFTNRVVRRADAAPVSNLADPTGTGGERIYRFRPESVVLGSAEPGAGLPLDGVVREWTFVGHAIEYKLDLGGHLVDARLDARGLGERVEGVEAGAEIQAHVPSRDLLAYEPDGAVAVEAVEVSV